MDSQGESAAGTSPLGQLDAEKVVPPQKSLVKTLFDNDFKRLSDQEMSDLVKEWIKRIVCKQALTLKREIEEEMNLKDEKAQLKAYLEELKIHRNMLLDAQQKEAEMAPSKCGTYKEHLKSIERTKATTMKNISSIMDSIFKMEHRMSRLKLAWEFFRVNYKDEVLTSLNQKLQSESNSHGLNWTYFLPNIGMPNSEGDVEEVRMTYYE